MAYPLVLVTKRDQHRLHLYLHNIVIWTAMEIAAGDEVFGNKRWLPPHFIAHTMCMVERKQIAIPFKGILHEAIHHPVPKRYVLLIEDQPPDGTYQKIVYTGFMEVNHAFHKAMFATYSEAAVEWVKRNFGTDYHAWPPVANFCRVVRNAFVHGGKINIRNEGAPTVSWGDISYDHTSFGNEIVDRDMTCGDLIVLMFALNAELDGLGAPLDLE